MVSLTLYSQRDIILTLQFEATTAFWTITSYLFSSNIILLDTPLFSFFSFYFWTYFHCSQLWIEFPSNNLLNCVCYFSHEKFPNYENYVTTLEISLRRITFKIYRLSNLWWHTLAFYQLILLFIPYILYYTSSNTISEAYLLFINIWVDFCVWKNVSLYHHVIFTGNNFVINVKMV